MKSLEEIIKNNEEAPIEVTCQQAAERLTRIISYLQFAARKERGTNTKVARIVAANAEILQNVSNTLAVIAGGLND